MSPLDLQALTEMVATYSPVEAGIPEGYLVVSKATFEALIGACRETRAALQRVVDNESPPWQYDELRAVLAKVRDDA